MHPIFAGARVYPDLIDRSCRCSLCLVDDGRRRGFMDVFLVRFDPVGGSDILIQ
jgi:hypothetical protein